MQFSMVYESLCSYEELPKRNTPTTSSLYFPGRVDCSNSVFVSLSGVLHTDPPFYDSLYLVENIVEVAKGSERHALGLAV